MSTCNNCNNCAWFCHSDRMCYGNAIQRELAVETTPDSVCETWSFDGLGDQEREELDVLVTMEV